MEKTLNQVYDTNYSDSVVQGWYPVIDRTAVDIPDNRWRFDRFVDFFVKVKTSDGVTNQKSKRTLNDKKNLDTQLKEILAVPDDQYSDSMLSPTLRKYVLELELEYVSTMKDYKMHLAPSYWEVKAGTFQISNMFGKTYYATSYPSYIDFLRTREMLMLYSKWDMSWFIYPADDSAMQSVLKRRSTQLKAEISTASQKWITYDSDVDIEFRDVENIRQKLATREERYYETSYYTTIYEHDVEKLREESKKFEQKIGWYWVRVKQASARMDEGQVTMLPLCLDQLDIPRSMVSTSLAWSFPFISNDLIENTWILYWMNLHSGSLVIFDRFAHKLPNANSLILATSWAWKSFATKLEIIRYLLLGIETIVIDPENEYKGLVEKVWGTYVNLIDWVSAEEEALLDSALQATYALKEITMDDDTVEWKTMPIMEDLLHVLEWMEWWDHMATKLSKYVTGTFAKLFNNHTNIDLNNKLTVFSIRDIEDALKTPAMFNVLNYIWTKVRSQKKKRLLVIDEAWIMMQQKVAAQFLYQLVKRARKYWLWVTTITQDVEDFITSEYGKPIVSNAAMQLLLKQSTSSIKSLESVFGLSEAEKQQLVSANIWEWLLFAGAQHVALKILWSPKETQFITTDI